MDYKEMIGFIVEQFNANHYGEFIKGGMVFDAVVLGLVPNGIDLEMNYRPIIGSECYIPYPFEEGRTTQEALAVSSFVMVGPGFWRMYLEEVLTNFADVCFDRFEDWTARSMTKTDTSTTRVIHVRFEVPEPMSEKKFTKWARSYQTPDYMLAEFKPDWFAIPFVLSGAAMLN